MSRAARLMLALLGAALLLSLLSLLTPHHKDATWSLTFARATAHTLVASAGVLVLAAGLGLPLGILSARGPNAADALLARLIELTGAFPTVLLLLLLGVLHEVTLLTFIAIVGLERALRAARILRGEVLAVLGRQSALSARAAGVRDRTLLLRHLSQHAFAPALLSLAFCPAAVIALDAALTLVGDSRPRGFATWGHVLAATTTFPQVVAPALGAIFVTAAAYRLARMPFAASGRATTVRPGLRRAGSRV